MISAGDVIDGTEAKLLAHGKKKIDITTKNVVDKAVRPVRPPLATPDEDSMYALVGVLPNKEAVSVAKESANNASLALNNLPFFTNPA